MWLDRSALASVGVAYDLRNQLSLAYLSGLIHTPALATTQYASSHTTTTMRDWLLLLLLVVCSRHDSTPES
jgi:hypothetical protein